MVFVLNLGTLDAVVPQFPPFEHSLRLQSLLLDKLPAVGENAQLAFVYLSMSLIFDALSLSKLT